MANECEHSWITTATPIRLTLKTKRRSHVRCSRGCYKLFSNNLNDAIKAWNRRQADETKGNRR